MAPALPVEHPPRSIIAAFADRFSSSHTHPEVDLANGHAILLFANAPDALHVCRELPWDFEKRTGTVKIYVVDDEHKMVPQKNRDLQPTSFDVKFDLALVGRKLYVKLPRQLYDVVDNNMLRQAFLTCDGIVPEDIEDVYVAHREGHAHREGRELQNEPGCTYRAVQPAVGR